MPLGNKESSDAGPTPDSERAPNFASSLLEDTPETAAQTSSSAIPQSTPTDINESSNISYKRTAEFGEMPSMQNADDVDEDDVDEDDVDENDDEFEHEYAYVPLQYMNIPEDPDNLDDEFKEPPKPIVLKLSKRDEIPQEDLSVIHSVMSRIQLDEAAIPEWAKKLGDSWMPQIIHTSETNQRLGR